MLNFDYEDPIAALATPAGESALAIIRTTGKDCICMMSAILKCGHSLDSLPGGRIISGRLTDPASGRALDHVTAAVFRAPHSYTGQDTVELFVHGSPPGIERILGLLFSLGFRQAGPGEFTQRAFLAGRMDLTRAEAVKEIIDSKSSAGLDLALRRLEGSVESRIHELKQSLLRMTARVEVQLDYAEDEDGTEGLVLTPEEVGEIMNQISALSDTYRIGRMFQAGVRIALAGRTNAGKSSLYNLFVKEDRAMVSPIHGTTRDYIESWIVIGGIPVSLFDTAGIRDSKDPLELEGMRRTGRVLGEADLIIYLVDGSEGIIEEDRRFLKAHEGDERVLYIWNKTDLENLSRPEGFLALSTKTMAGFRRLEQEVLQVLSRTQHIPGVSASAFEGPIIDSLRQKKLLDRAVSSLGLVRESILSGRPLDMIALDLGDALQALGEITGEVTSEDILDAVFSGFCVGK